MKNIVILGSTGSIGTQALDVIKKNKNKFKIVGLSGHRNLKLLKEQVKKFKPDVFSEGENLSRLASYKKADLVLNALSGTVGVSSSIEALKAGKNLALANKESILLAGKKLLSLAKKKKVNLIPVDSEHTGIFQILKSAPKKKIKKIYITCSGGPFYKTEEKDLHKIKNSEVLNHPVWKMGSKNSIDSATLMNKGFEFIECCILYGVKPDQVEILYHPEGIVHCIVEFTDDTILANMSAPDMRMPIAYTLFYPKKYTFKVPSPKNKKLNIGNIEDKFGLLKICKDAAKDQKKIEKLVQIDETGVDKFIAGNLNFLGLIKYIKDEYSRYIGRR